MVLKTGFRGKNLSLPSLILSGRLGPMHPAGLFLGAQLGISSHRPRAASCALPACSLCHRDPALSVAGYLTPLASDLSFS